MTTITKNSYYDIEVDEPANRVFLTIKGFWSSKRDVPIYLDDWDRALAKVSPGFTLLTDATNMTLHPTDIQELHAKAQEKLVLSGVRKVAELQEQKQTQEQLDDVSYETKMPKLNFYDRQKAIAWLDEL